MNSENKTVRALGLCSGGLDSILAARVLQKQNIAVEWIAFETPFFSADRARKAAQDANIPLYVENITQTYMPMLKNPPNGYGKHMNPCMDCHALMFKLAGRMLKSHGFDFLFSGEVFGQRPMSQTGSSLRYVAKHSGFDGYILRPLSALQLPESIPEQKGLVRRDRLLDISGRSRKTQMRLAEQFGISDYPSPAGGCLLTDKGFSLRLKDLLQHSPEPFERELHLLKFGRHFRLNEDMKIIVGRQKKDNESIASYYDARVDTLVKVAHFAGPTTLIPHGGKAEGISLAAAICAGYSKAPENKPVEVYITAPAGKSSLRIIGILPKEVKRFIIGADGR